MGFSTDKVLDGLSFMSTVSGVDRRLIPEICDHVLQTA